jgi:predicted GIY-YIG superfamily endonuclease
MKKEKQYIYITQAQLEPSKCKIGKTNDLERRLKEYNSTTGVSKENNYSYLFTCEVENSTQLENDIKKEFIEDRESKNKEIYFFNPTKFENYKNFIKSHEFFVEEIFTKPEAKPTVREIIVKRTTPSLKERGLTHKDIMQRAKRVKNDEFYTRYVDVEKELSMYDKSIWKNKTVFCNCDDAVDDKKNERKTSNFALYFLRNFKELKLKKLICTHYSGGEDLFNQRTKGKGYVHTFIFTKDGFEEFRETPPGYDGSFDHPLSLKLLKEDADIVCTNPPFSRAIDYWKILIDSGKKFIIVSNVTNPITTAFISYFKNNLVWAGYNRIDWYENPRRQLSEAPGHWYTNFPIKKRDKHKHLKIMPLKEIPEKYAHLITQPSIPDNTRRLRLWKNGSASN